MSSQNDQTVLTPPIDTTETVPPSSPPPPIDTNPVVPSEKEKEKATENNHNHHQLGKEKTRTEDGPISPTGHHHVRADDVAQQVGDGVDLAYEQKSQLVNACMQNEIGMGRYQWELFVVSGFGWLADNLWIQGVAVVLPQINVEFNPSGNSGQSREAWITFALYMGLICGAALWGILADVIGRKLSWLITLFIAGIFGTASGGGPTFAGVGCLIAFVGFGIGGNLPVDGALYLEFVPQSYQWTLTLLSAWWSLGQLIASLVAWGFINNYSCASDVEPGQCAKADNMGWRYTLIVLGVITLVMWVARYFIFKLQESPKYLLAKGRDEDAIKVLHYVAARNKTEISLTLEQLQEINADITGDHQVKSTANKSLIQSFIHSVKGFDLSHFKPLFSTKRLGINTVMITVLWGLIGLAYPLYNSFLPTFLTRNVGDTETTVYETYRNYSIISVCGIPGSMLACVLVEFSRGSGKFSIGGRKFAMGIFTIITGVFLFVFTTASTEAQVLAFNCIVGFGQNAMYGVLYAYTPESFPGPHRGTGDALCSSFNRITGAIAPLVAIFASLESDAPLYVSATLFLVSAVIMFFLPIETRGRAAI